MVAGCTRGSTHSTSRSGRSGHSPRNSARFELDSSMANSTNCANLKHGYNSSAEGYIPGKLPLPNDFFPVPQLSAKENRYLLGLAKHACKEVVYYSRHQDGPMKWLHLSSNDGVDVFQGVDISGSNDAQQDAKGLTYLRGSCKIHATIDEISDFFKLDTPEKLSGFTQTVGRDLLDQKTLLTLATPTLDNPKHYVAVKWTAVESPSKLARSRDFCYIECHDEFIDANTKRRGWVRSMHSIRLPFCPPLTRSHNLVRGSFYRSGYIFTESADKGYVDAVHTLHVDIKGNAPNWLKILTMKRRITNIAYVNHYFQRQRLAQETLLGEKDLPAKELVTRCQLCDIRFGLFHRRRLCRKCGKVVCNSCGTVVLLDPESVGPTKVRICVECSEFGKSVPMMDQSVIVVNGTKQKNLGVSQSMIYLENRPHWIDEHEFLLVDEDANELADVEAAKRTNLKFEDLLKEARENAEVKPELRNFNLKTMASFEMKGAFDEAESPSLSTNDLTLWKDPVDAKREEVDKTNMLLECEMEHQSEMNIPPSRPRVYGFVGSGPEESLQWGSKRMHTRFERDIVTRIHSNDDVTKPDLSKDRSRSRSRSTAESRCVSPSHHGKTGSRSRHNSVEEERGSVTYQTRRRLTNISTQRRYADTTTALDRKIPRYRASDSSNGTGVPAHHQPAELKLESPTLLMNNSNRGGQDQRNDDFHDPENEAFRLAMSAMRLYEEERGPNLHVAEETRQVALVKMMKVYAREIKRCQSVSMKLYSRDTISDTRQVKHEIKNSRRMRRTFDDDRPPYDVLPLQISRQDQRQVTTNNLSCRKDSIASMLSTKKTSEEVYEYRDLSDLSISAFQAFQRSSRGSKPALQVSVENNDVYYQHEEVSPTSVHFQQGSTNFAHVQTKSDASAHPRNNSMNSSDIVDRLLRPNSMFGLADEDTFSDMDLKDLPHLMCKDDNRVQTVNSFADLQHWTKESFSENGGLEYVEEPRISDLLSPLYLDDVQHVEDDDSESQSSTSSSQIDWQATISEKVPLGHHRAAAIPHQNEAISSLIEKNNFSESMVTQNEVPNYHRQYSQLPSLPNLLSEYCESDRSSLPSYLEFGGSQSELEPEYLEAIAKASSEIVSSMEEERRRRESSIPSELESMMSRELCT
ncbi:hypothetical protein F444_22064 [Plasmopara halstedii]|uniref:FYVE-type domain-containing protein n=1 Tax=Plasmopara halstedii TaxID=4781 RepID=A0A0P1B7N7_PLAHL|nr:hypothetical protein F444_22064 [Plasmopara halstedii]CEG49885.1 hypothetical protein F444_22064 [Plasmopara halstedii]|eukprot:XP_024586254.1 hypothetical protein F444_22064 [Plasmopara halstedii]